MLCVIIVLPTRGKNRRVKRMPIQDVNWRRRAACRDEDPELFFPVGHSGPALIQVEQAKSVCRRCSATEACLRWALESGQDAGVWGGMSEVERRAVKRAVKNRT